MKILPIEQRSAEWHNLRRNKIGASMAPIIMGESPYKTPHGLWEEMLGLNEPTIPTEAMKRGIALEDEARKLFQKMTKLEVEPVVIQHDEYDWMIASLDGMDLSCKNIVEIKCGSSQEHYEALLGKVPQKYYAQLQHQMFVSGIDDIFYFNYCFDMGVIVKIKKDEKYIDKMLKKEKEFWDCLQNIKEPEITDRDYIERYDAEWEMLAKRWKVINSHIQELKKEEENVRKSLIECSRGCNIKGSGIKMSKIIKKGSIDYTAIEELKNIDLERYRKKSIITHRIQTVDNVGFDEYVHCIGSE